MAMTNKGMDKIETALLAAHKRRPSVELPPGWQAGLMTEVRTRRRCSTPRGQAMQEAFARLLLRFAGVGAAAAAALLLAAGLATPDLEAHAARLVLDNPAAAQALEAILWS